MHPELQGTVILGADALHEAIGAVLPWQPQPGDQYLVLHVRNIADVVKKEGGDTGKAAYSFIPQTVQTFAYDKIAKELRQKFAERGVDLDLSIQGQPPPGGISPRDFATGFLLGGVIVSVGWLLARFLRSG